MRAAAPSIKEESENRGRLVSAAGVAALHALLGYTFLIGLASEFIDEESDRLKTFQVEEAPPPPPAQQPPPAGAMTKRKNTPNPEGAASPPNLTDSPTQVMVPPARVRLEVPPPIVAAPVAGHGNAAAAGAASEPGPGTGSGGSGAGFGSGTYGNGYGGGGGGLEGVDRGAARARWLRGGFTDPDYPRSAYKARIEGTVHLQLLVNGKGRVAECKVIQSSGARDLDNAACRVMKQRFVFRPARNSKGQPTQDVVDWTHHWWIRNMAAPGPNS